MTNRDRETLALPWWRETVASLGDKPVVLRRIIRTFGKPYRHCPSHRGLFVHSVLFLVKAGVLTLQSESDGVAVYVRAEPAEPKAAWNGGL